MVKNVLVTGGAGYIGSHTVNLLKKNGYNPIVLDNLIYGHKEFIEKELNVPLIKGDIGDENLVYEILESFEISSVIHFAAYAYVGESVGNPRIYYENNLVGSIKLINSIIDFGLKNDCSKHLPFVYSSSCATYGVPIKLPISEKTPQLPINPYGATKLFVERVLKDYRKAYNFNSISFRYFNAAGSSPTENIGEDHNPETHLIPLAIRAANDPNFTLTIFGNDYPTIDGTCVRDYIHVDDIANAHLKGLFYLEQNTNALSSAYNLGNGSGYSVHQVIRSIERVSGKKVKVKYGSRREGDPPILVASSKKAYEELGWKPKYNELDQIIFDALVWFNKRFAK